jgi:RNA ligase (TIGR02306 family)
MSEFHVEVIEITNLTKHPGADTLEITQIHGGYPVIIRIGDFKVGDKATYCPIDSLCPMSNPTFKFLKMDDGDQREYVRIKAKRLRGVFSMGLLVPAQPDWVVGQNVQEVLGIKKWEPELEPNFKLCGEDEVDHVGIPCYTDVEGYRKHKNALLIGEEVVLTEKLHGRNARFVWAKDRLWCGSHTRVKRQTAQTVEWVIAAKYDLENKLRNYPDLVFFGEIYGQIQRGFQYDIPKGEAGLRVFDILNLKTRRYLDWADVVSLCGEVGLTTVPVLFQGPWNEELTELRNGKTTLGNHTREGIVIHPTKERLDNRIGRVILKFVGEDYLLKQ